jgi:hypothetical protein
VKAGVDHEWPFDRYGGNASVSAVPQNGAEGLLR